MSQGLQQNRFVYFFNPGRKMDGVISLMYQSVCMSVCGTVALKLMSRFECGFCNQKFIMLVLIATFSEDLDKTICGNNREDKGNVINDP